MADSTPPNVRPGGSAPGAPGSPSPAGPAPGVPVPGAPMPGGGVAPGGAAPAHGADRQGMMDLVKRFVDSLNKRDWKAVQGMLSDDHHDPTGSATIP